MGEGEWWQITGKNNSKLELISIIVVLSGDILLEYDQC